MRKNVKYNLRKILELPHIIFIRIVNTRFIKKIRWVSQYKLDMKCKDIRIAGSTSNKMMHQHLLAKIELLRSEVEELKNQLTEK